MICSLQEPQSFGGVLDVVLAESRDEKVRVIIALEQSALSVDGDGLTYFLETQLESFDFGGLGGFREILWQQLALLVEVVASPLRRISEFDIVE